jgi:hypothetical protein
MRCDPALSSWGWSSPNDRPVRWQGLDQDNLVPVSWNYRRKLLRSSDKSLGLGTMLRRQRNSGNPEDRDHESCGFPRQLYDQPFGGEYCREGQSAPIQDPSIHRVKIRRETVERLTKQRTPATFVLQGLFFIASRSDLEFFGGPTSEFRGQTSKLPSTDDGTTDNQNNKSSDRLYCHKLF